MTEGENWLLNISDTETASSPRNTKAISCLHISVVHLPFYIAMGAHRPTLRVILSFSRGFAATSDKVR